MEAKENFRVIVRFIDIGITKTLDFHQLKKISSIRKKGIVDEHITNAALAYRIHLPEIDNMQNVLENLNSVLENWQNKTVIVKFLEIKNYYKSCRHDYQEIIGTMKCYADKDLLESLGGKGKIYYYISYFRNVFLNFLSQYESITVNFV